MGLPSFRTYFEGVQYPALGKQDPFLFYASFATLNDMGFSKSERLAEKRRSKRALGLQEDHWELQR